MHDAHANMGIQDADLAALVENLQAAMRVERVPYAAQNRLLAKLAPMRRTVVKQKAPCRRPRSNRRPTGRPAAPGRMIRPRVLHWFRPGQGSGQKAMGMPAKPVVCRQPRRNGPTVWGKMDMATTYDGEGVRHHAASRNEKLIIGASSLGTVFEWYDFYLYGLLATYISKQFFSGVNETTGFILALGAFAAGFAVRPFGALVFGRIGDLVGRKNTFLVTMGIMGLSTFGVGLLPSYASIGIAAPIILVALRILQGLALGGEYGGAATYVAEHAPNDRRGLYTSFIQTTATLGLFAALLIVIGIRTGMARKASGRSAGAFRSSSRSSCSACRCGSGCSCPKARCS